MKKMLVALVLVAIGGSYFAGYWPQRRKRLVSEASLATTRADLERSEARNRLYGLQSRLIDLMAAVDARNFGDAQVKATAFFDATRQESGRPDQAQARTTLEKIVAQRDSMTVALTQNDPTAIEMLRGAMTQLRVALGDVSPQAAMETVAAPTAPTPR